MIAEGPLIAVDTSYKNFSVALWVKGSIYEFIEDEEFHHVEGLNVKVVEVLKKATVHVSNIKAVLITIGPGYFTSLRVAASFAKALHLIRGTPMYGFNTLQAMAVGLEDGRYLPILDARKGQIYAQSFVVKGGIPKEDGRVPLGIYHLSSLPSNYILVTSERLKASNLFKLYFAGFYKKLEPNFSPLYIRPPDAVVMKGKMNLRG